MYMDDWAERRFWICLPCRHVLNEEDPLPTHHRKNIGLHNCYWVLMAPVSEARATRGITVDTPEGSA